MMTAYDKEMFKKLPRPTKDFHTKSDAEVVAWLRECGEKAGSEGIRFAFSANQWPGTRTQRLEVWSKMAELEREFQERERAEHQKRTAEIRAKSIANEKKQREKYGWGGRIDGR